MAERTIRIAYTGGPFDGDIEDFKANAEPPPYIKRARPAPIAFDYTKTEPEDPPPSLGICEYKMRGGPGLVGRTGDGAWIYDYKGEQ